MKAKVYTQRRIGGGRCTCNHVIVMSGSSPPSGCVFIANFDNYEAAENWCLAQDAAAGRAPWSEWYC